eukprot:CAMPEP_0194204224 /NCGR_PEP_ID=MMETSP0156-20130528/3814_1 /TAXON_ID=33649 /ORGANISM="Thalassionema nitzschioides, Strain L26-B" /LENGTH=308 /DNA_ID=CAMNT_0038930189 /DNA_START=75 /DNA_END=1001 /DNA_ORIENTATION=+
MKTIHNSPVSPLELSELMMNSPAAPNLEDSSNLEIATGREMLRLALKGKQRGPISLPQDYVRVLCGDSDSIDSATKGDVFIGKDAILNQSFSVVTTDDAQTIIESYSDHSNLQRLYGYCHLDDNISILVLECLQKGTVDEFLSKPNGRVQLHAQRRIQIMLDAARILHSSKQALDLASGNIGLNLHLATKVCVPTEIPKDSFPGNTFSFGILMIELLTGALQNNRSEDRKFGDFFERYAKGSGKIIEDDLDPCVRESWTFNILSQLIELAKGCIEEDVEKRPSTEKLVDTLTLIESRMNVVASCYDYY